MSSAPVILDGQALPRRIGQVCEFERDVPIIDDAAVTVFRVPNPWHTVGTATLVDDGILVDATITGVAEGACIRCLEPLTRVIEQRLQELFVEPAVRDKAIAEGDEEAADWFTVDKRGLDIEPAVVDIVRGSMDPRPLCEPDCPGLCDQCGASLRDDPDHSHEIIDDRWKELEKLRDSL